MKYLDIPLRYRLAMEDKYCTRYGYHEDGDCTRIAAMRSWVINYWNTGIDSGIPCQHCRVVDDSQNSCKCCKYCGGNGFIVAGRDRARMKQGNT